MQTRAKLQEISQFIIKIWGIAKQVLAGFAFNKGFQTFELYNLHLDSGSI